MVNKNTFTCPTCHRVSTEYRHGLTRMLVSCLWHLHCAGGQSRLDKLGLTNTEFTNFQKLRYFGLAMPTGAHNEWILTPKGKEFLQGRRKVAIAVFTLNARIQRYSVETAFVHEIKDCVQFKVEWQEQAGQPTLFD